MTHAKHRPQMTSTFMVGSKRMAPQMMPSSQEKSRKQAVIKRRTRSIKDASLFKKKLIKNSEKDLLDLKSVKTSKNNPFS